MAICSTSILMGQETHIYQGGVISVEDQHDDYVSHSPDGTFLVFTRLTDNYRQGTIYISKKDGENWSQPFTAPFSGKYNDSRPFISPNGKRIYFASNRPTEKRPEKRDLDIWYVERMSNKWSAPVNVGENVNSEANETHPSVARNGNLYFARWGGSTNDIFFSKFTHDTFQKAIPHPSINTHKSESHPFIDPDEKYILFGSARDAEGLDGEVYISVVKNGEWALPEKLEVVNSPLYDYSAKVNAARDKIYFSRTDFRPEGKKADIYSVDINWDELYLFYFNTARFEPDLKSPGNTEIIDVAFIDNWPVVSEVYVNGKGPFSFMIDLGASGLGRIDQSLYEKLGLEISGSRTNSDGAGNTWTQQTVAIDRLKLGQVSFSAVNLPMRDYSEGVRSGILGLGFFADNLLTIDYPQSRIVLSNDVLVPKDSSFLTYDRAFIVQGTVAGIEFDFSIDTGSQLDFHFPSSFLTENAIEYEDTGETTTLIRSGGDAIGHQARVKGWIIIGGLKVKDPVIWYSDLQDRGRINVGSGTLKNYKVVIDQKNRLVSLR